MTIIKFFRGLKNNLPASAEEGEPLLTIDTGELYTGMGLNQPLKKIAGSSNIDGGSASTIHNSSQYIDGGSA